MRPLLPLILTGLLWSFHADAGDIYRCVTENGVVRYAAFPCRDGKAEKLGIDSSRTDPAAVQERVEKRKEKIAAIEQAEADAEKAAGEAAKQKEQRQQACAAARERAQKLESSRRVTIGEGEDERYLESEEIVKRRQEAQDKVRELCGDEG